MIQVDHLRLKHDVSSLSSHLTASSSNRVKYVALNFVRVCYRVGTNYRHGTSFG